jgi:hypothetical protein
MCVKSSHPSGAGNSLSILTFCREIVIAEVVIVRRKLVALFTAAALVATGPAIAQSRAASAPSVERSGAEMEKANELRGGYLIPTVAIIGLILLILALTDTWPFDDEPVSP